MSCFAYVLRRIVQAVPTLLGLTLASFLIIKVTPGDPAVAILGPRATPERVAEIRHQFGLDRGVAVQYGKFLQRVVVGDLGESHRNHQAVSTIIQQRWPVTAWLIAGSVVLTVLVSVPLASIAAMRRGRWTDHAIRAGTAVGLGMPAFWVGLMLIVLVAQPTGWFPVGGHFGTSWLDHARAAFLPSLTMAVSLTPLVVRSLRSSMVAVLDADYVAAARSIGVAGPRLVRSHVLRNAAVPVISLLAVQVSYLLFGVVLMEQAFDLNGLGQAMVFAALGRDYPVIIGITLLFGVAVVTTHIVADITMAFVDPRIRLT